MKGLEVLAGAIGVMLRILLVFVAFSIAADFLFFSQHPTKTHPYSAEYAYTGWAALVIAALPERLLRKFPWLAGPYIAVAVVAAYAVASAGASLGDDRLIAGAVLSLLVLLALQMACISLLFWRHTRQSP